MRHRLRLILTFIFRGPGSIGDVNLQYVPMPLMLLWFGCMKLWYCVPVVSRRIKYEELKQGTKDIPYLQKWVKEAQGQAQEFESLSNEYEYELRKLKQFDTILDVKKRVADKDTYEYPRRSYQDDYSQEPRSVISSPVMKYRRTKE